MLHRAGGTCCRSRELKLLVGSGGFLFQKRLKRGMDSLDKHVKQITFRQCVNSCENRQLKGWHHRFHLREAKSLVCFSHIAGSFSAAATNGWAGCSHNAELVQGTVALRNLKLLVGIGCFEFQEGMAGMGSLDKHVLTFCEHGQLKGRQPHCQSTEAKSWISTILHWLAAVA